MKEKNKLLLTFLVLVIIICSIFAVAIEYQILGVTKAKEEKLPLLVKIFVPENYGAKPFEVNFTSLVLYYNRDIKYNWDFGDDTTSDKINPTHIYNQSGVFNCTLTITDSSEEKSSDNVKITVRENEAPFVSITLSDLKPSRPFIPIIRLKWLSQNYNGQNFRRIIDLDIFPKSLLNITGFVSCYANASSPEGNKIESYNWELRPPTYNSVTFKQIKPVYYFVGQNLTIPLLYIYPEAPYDLTVIVTDSKGFKGTNTIKLEVQLSPLESRIRSLKTSIGLFRQQVWHNVFKAILGETTADIIYDNLFPLIPGLPLAKIIFTIFILYLNWGLNPGPNIISNLLVKFLEKIPRIRNVIKIILEGIISTLEKIKQNHPNNPKLVKANDKLINILEILLEFIGISNKRPVLSNETPSDNSKFLSTDYPEVSIKVEDPEGDPFNITIHGQYVDNLTRFNQYNDTFITTLKTPLPNLNTIEWHVNISYSQNRWINDTYKFSTW